jgi:exonuclease III
MARNSTQRADCYLPSPSRFSMSRKLSVLTWNVWFDQLSRSKRYTEILDVCDALRPDIVCFQEVTPVFMDIYSKHKLGDVYDNSGTCWGEGRFPYGVVSLCKKEMQPRFRFFELISDMNRNLLTTCVDGPRERFASVTCIWSLWTALNSVHAS